MATRSMSEQAYFVLSALADEPRHGYAILGEVTELSEGRVRLRVGTLYGILDRLSSTGLIEVDREEVVDSRLRRYYRLSNSGRHALTREVARLQANARAGAARIAGWTPGTAHAESAIGWAR